MDFRVGQVAKNATESFVAAKFNLKGESERYIFIETKQGLVMKNLPLLSLFYGLLALSLFACKKDADQKGKTAYDSKFSFSYKGHHYELPLKDGIAEWGTMEAGIFINRPDIFHGAVFFPNSNCAYLEPTGSSVERAANCVLTQYGLPIDSSAVYIYSAGIVRVDYSNCSLHSEYDPYTGSTVQYEVCDAHGTFTLTLKNNNNDSIVVNDGKLEQYSFRK